MKKIILAATLAAAAGATWASDNATETRAIDARVSKVTLGGVIELHLKQGTAPALVLSGDPKLLAKVTTVQHGDALDIDMEKMHFSWGKHESLRADLTVPNLKEFISTGVGSADVTGFNGDEIRLALDGAGSVKMASHYRNINLRLGGVGSMKIDAGDTENVDVTLKGAGHIEIAGAAKSLRAKLGGVGGLDAKELRTDAVSLDLTGLGGATVFAKNSANVSLSGLGSATVYGNPATRSASTHGMGSVSWK